MDFHNLKRRELQILCKKHKIPANLTNLEMAEKLTAILTVNEKPLTRGRRSCLKGLDEDASENESDVENRPAKKVRFSPENEMIEFEKSEVRDLETRGRGRRKSVMFMDMGRAGVVTADNDGVNEEVRELRRSRRGKLPEGSEVESKGGKKDTKSEVRDLETRGCGRRKSVMFMDKGRGGVVTSDNDGVNEEVRELRRSRRGKLPEESEVESKGGKKDTKVDAKGNSIVDDMVNGEVGEIRRSSRGKLSEKREVESRRTNAKQLNVLDDNCNVDIGEVREVRRSRRGKSSEGSEVETKGQQRVIKVDAHNGIVDMSNGDVREIRRSKRGKLTAGSDALKANLPSAAENVPSLNLQNEEHIAVKQFLRKRETLDVEKRENEDDKKGSEKGTRVRNLRSRKEEDHEDVAGSKEAVTKSACVHLEAAVRMSNRHVEKVDYAQVVNEKARKNKNVSRGTVAVKECSLGEGKLRRLQRNASRPACSISMQGSDVITIKNNGKETIKQRRVAVLEGEATGIDEGNPNERSFKQIKLNTKRSRRVVPAVKEEKVAKGKGNSKKTNIEVENSFSKDIPTTMADHDTHASSLKAPEDNVCNNGNNDELSSSVPDLESTVLAESNFSIEKHDFGTDSGTFLDSAPSPLTENAVQKLGETFTNVERNENNDCKTTIDIKTPLAAENDCLALQNDCVESNLEYFNVDKQHGVMAENMIAEGHSASICKVIEEKAKLESFNGKEREELDLEEHNSSEPENPLTLNDALEGETFTNVERNESNDCKTTIDIKTPLATEKDCLALQNDCVESNLEYFNVEKQHGVMAENAIAEGHSASICKVIEEKAKLESFNGKEREQLDLEEHNSSERENPLTLNDALEGETFTNVERNESNDCKTTIGIKTPLATNDCLALQNACVESNLEYFNVDKQHGVMAEDAIAEGHSASICKVIEEKAKLENFNGKEREQLDLEEHNSSEPENPLTLNDAFEGVVNDCNSEAIQTTSLNADESKQAELTSATHSTNTMEQREELTIIQMNGCGPHHVSATATNFDHPDLSSFKDSKSDEVGDSNIDSSDSIEESREPKSPGSFGRSATTNQLDGDVNCGEDIIYPSDMQGEVLVSTSPSTKSVEIATEFSESIYVSKRVESLQSNLIMEADDVDLERHSEMSAQSPSELKNSVEADLYEDGHLAESSKGEEVGQLKPLNDGLDHCLESPELNSSVRTMFSAMQDKDGRDNGDSVAISDIWDHSLLSHELNSFARTKFSIIPDRDLLDVGDSIAACDVPGVVLCLSGEDTQIVVGGEGTEIALSSGRSCSRSSNAQKSSSLLEHQPAGTNTESNHNLLMDDNMPNQGYGDCGEAKVEEESISMEALFMIKKPTAGEDVGIEKCAMSIDKSLKGVTDILEDQPELMWEGMEKGIYDSEAATYVEKHEAYVGKEDEPVNLQKGNSNELESPHHLIAATEDFREDAGVPHESKLSPLQGTNFQKEGTFTDTVDSEKHSEPRAQLSKQRNRIDEDFLTEIHEHSEEGQILQVVAESEEARNLMDQHGRFDDGLMHDNLNSPATTTQIVGGRCTEIELSARKSSSMSSRRPFIFEFQSVGTESKHRLSTDDNAQNQGDEACFGASKENTDTVRALSIIQTPSISEYNNAYDNAQGHEACFEGGNKEGTDTVRAFSIIETPSTSKDDGLERSDMLMDGRLFGETEVANDELGSLSKSMVRKINCLSDCKAAIERETKETEEGEPLNPETSDTIEAKTVSCAIEVVAIAAVDGCPSNAAHTALNNSNENEQVETSEISFTEPVSNPNPMAEEHTSNQEKGMELAMLSIGMGRVEDSCKFEEKSTKEEQEKKVSGHEDSVDAEEDEKWSITHQNICTDAFEETNEDEPQVLFDISKTSHENATVQAPDNGALQNPVSHVASAEGRDCSVLQEPDGALLQHDEQKIDDFKFRGEIDVEKGVSIDDNHAHMLSLEIKIPPSETKSDDSFPFDHIKDAEEVAETSLAMLFGTQVETPWINPEEIVTDSVGPDPAATEFAISKDQFGFMESEVFDSMIDNADSEPAPSTKAPSSTSRSYLSTELAQLVEPEAVSVEKPVGGVAGENNPQLNKDLMKTEAESISGTAEHQCAANARSAVADHQHAAKVDRVAAFERDLIPKSKTDFTRSKNLIGTAGENFGSTVKYTPSRNNARSILIHGTPINKLQRAANMKENEPSSKLEKVGTLTSVKSAKRPALKPWK